MQIHNLKRNSKRKTTKDVGRGGKRGKTAGRGTKGQNARAGRKFRPVMRDVIKKLPKLRGYAFNSHKAKAVAINLSDLSVFQKGETVNPKTLSEKGILHLKLGKFPTTKILGVGEIKVALNFERVKVSTEARAKIEKAGGTIKEESKVSTLRPKAERRAAKAAK
jgi:large subunit ribosomal protein L15